MPIALTGSLGAHHWLYDVTATTLVLRYPTPDKGLSSWLCYFPGVNKLKKKKNPSHNI